MKYSKLLITLLAVLGCQNQPELKDDEPALWSWSLPTELRIFPQNSKGEPVADYSELHYLAFYADNHKLLEKALEDGANPNQKAWAGNTPLHFAAAAGKTKHCDILMKAGACINVKNKRGLTPVDYAKELKNKNAEKVLTKKKEN